VFGLIAKIIDGVIDVPMASFTDNLKTRFGRRRPALIIGLVPMILAYVLFALVTPYKGGESLGNTFFYGIALCVFYSFYTLTMVTYYATFTEIVDTQEERNFISNVKSVCDIVYFILGYVVVRMLLNGMNIRPVAMIVLPIVATMLIPLFLIKEDSTKDGVRNENGEEKAVGLFQSIRYTFMDKKYILWMVVYSFMTLGVQLFLSGINEYFSVSGMSMIFVMMAAFAPVPFTLIIYNKLTKKKGFAFSFRYTLAIFAIGMAAMFLVSFVPTRPVKFSFDYTVTEADVRAGHIDSTITATGRLEDGSTVSDSYDYTLLTTDAS
jgi:GPH family glycoside/pentoside/hexuronide:cation symporter